MLICPVSWHRLIRHLRRGLHKHIASDDTSLPSTLFLSRPRKQRSKYNFPLKWVENIFFFTRTGYGMFTVGSFHFSPTPMTNLIIDLIWLYWVTSCHEAVWLCAYPFYYEITLPFFLIKIVYRRFKTPAVLQEVPLSRSENSGGVTGCLTDVYGV